ncbi:MAG: hypothetical protein KBA66_20410, partial [Leptospiraceae bacterium]|nr:hypothetical protein [Leptospiraceae bacterium]
MMKSGLTNKIIGLGWVVFVGIFFWVNTYSLFSNHKEFTYKPSKELEFVTDIPSSDSFGDNLI